MILMEKNIDQVMFLCMFSHMNEVIVRIMKMTVKNHFPHKSCIENDCVYAA